MNKNENKTTAMSKINRERDLLDHERELLRRKGSS